MTKASSSLKRDMRNAFNGPFEPHSCSSLYLPFSFSAKANRYLNCVRPVQMSVTKVGRWNNCEWIVTGRTMQPFVIILGLYSWAYMSNLHTDVCLGVAMRRIL
jgi:hypothetical protein